MATGYPETIRLVIIEMGRIIKGIRYFVFYPSGGT